MTALGCCAADTWSALQRGEFIRQHSAAKLDTSDYEIAGVSRVAALATHAAREAIAAAGWSSQTLCDPSTAIVFGTSKGDINRWIAQTSTSDNMTEAGRPQKLTSTCGSATVHAPFDIGAACAQMCEQLNHPAGPRLTLSAACASGLHALIRADLLLRGGYAERVLVVAAEASIHPLFLASFNRLGILASGQEPGRPFDRNRTGFRMSEAAAAVTLERPNTSHDGPPQTTLTHMALAGEAAGLVAGDRQSHAMLKLLTDALNHGPIDIIHAHGTGTVLNDALELAAIEAALQGYPDMSPAIFSHKGALGHSLGASGLVSVVLAMMAHQHGQLPAMPTTIAPEPTTRAILNPAGRPEALRNSLILANGFGGPIALVKLTMG